MFYQALGWSRDIANVLAIGHAILFEDFSRYWGVLLVLLVIRVLLRGRRSQR
jgi:hypothetical protein